MLGQAKLWRGYMPTKSHAVRCKPKQVLDANRLRSYCFSWWFSRYASAGLQVWLVRRHQPDALERMRRRLLAFRAKTQNEGGN